MTQDTLTQRWHIRRNIENLLYSNQGIENEYMSTAINVGMLVLLHHCIILQYLQIRHSVFVTRLSRL